MMEPHLGKQQGSFGCCYFFGGVEVFVLVVVVVVLVLGEEGQTEVITVDF